MKKCLICSNEFSPFVDFGKMPIANAFSNKNDLKNEYFFPMKVGFCENCNMVQLLEQPDREKMFHAAMIIKTIAELRNARRKAPVHSFHLIVR